jgi:HK97 family phage major capsid protein
MFKDKSEAREYFSKAGMSKEDVEALIVKNHADLPEKAPQQAVKLVDAEKALEAKAVDIEAKINTNVETKQAEQDDMIAQQAAEIEELKANIIKLADARMGSPEIELHDKYDETGGFNHIGDFALEVMKSEKRGNSHSEKMQTYLEKAENFLKEKAAGSPTLAEDVFSDGGALVPTAFSTEISKRGSEASKFLPMVRMMEIAGLSINIPYLSDFDHSSNTVHGGVQMKWLAETASKTATKPALGGNQYTLQKLAGLAYVSDELLADSAVPIGPFLTEVFGDAVGFETDRVLYSGTGAGQPRGILNAASKITVSKQTGQAASTIQFENLRDMYAQQHNKTKAVWIANHDTLPQLMSMSFDAGTSSIPVWLPASNNNVANIAEAPMGTLFGRPLIITEHAEALGTEGDISFVDWSQYQMIRKVGATQGVNFATSIHLKFDNDQTTYRIVLRTDGKIWWPQAFTPANSSSDLSPVITLETRSS